MLNSNFEEEEKKYREILMSDPKNAKAAFNLGKLLEEKGDVVGATDIMYYFIRS